MFFSDSESNNSPQGAHLSIHFLKGISINRWCSSLARALFRDTLIGRVKENNCKKPATGGIETGALTTVLKTAALLTGMVGN